MNKNELDKYVKNLAEDDAETRLLSLKPECGYWLPMTLKDGELVSATEPDEIGWVKCSECGETFEESEMANYCPNCGIKMSWDMCTFLFVPRYFSGRWEVFDKEHHLYSCSMCGYVADKKYNYCTNCGAKME